MPVEQYTESIVLQEMKCVIGKPAVCVLDDYSQGGNGKAKTAFSLVPQNDFIFRFCFIHLKNNSTCHRLLYMSAISCAE